MFIFICISIWISCIYLNNIVICISFIFYLINLYKEKKFPCKILRFYMVYGPKQDENRLISTIIKSCLLDKKFPCSSGNQLRDFLYVDDAVSAIIKCLENSKKCSCSGVLIITMSPY